MRKKNVVVKSTHKGKRWVLEISGNDREARKAIVKAILQLPAKGIEILNGADPFGAEPEPRQKKLKPEQESGQVLAAAQKMGLAL